MSVTVRPASEEDIETVEAVARDAWYAAYGGFLAPETVEAGLAENYDAELLAAAVDHDDVEFLVAVADGEVVGFASAERTWADEVELHTLYVHPDRWGEGVGSALLDEIAEWAREVGVDRIACGVLADNAVGVGFFEARGFTRGLEARGEVGGELHPEYEFELEL
jgi:GNAT superfamily N-acetyltransferase